jgi:glycosyltransferase involved in cell wall biosynthesis
MVFLFVNDGSNDGTRELLDELSRGDGEHFKVLHLERNCGKAEAIRRGMQEVFRLSPTYAGYWDADLATPLEAIPEFTEHLDTHPRVEMIFGSRVRLMGHRIVRRPLRHYLGRLFATVASAILGISIYDTQCGAKLFRVIPAIKRLFTQPYSSRWIFDVEILARYLHEFRAAPRGSADDVIHEIPLLRWEDAAGSNVRPLDFLRAIHELWVIHRTWLRPSAAPRGREDRAVTRPDDQATWVAPNQEPPTRFDPSLS